MFEIFENFIASMDLDRSLQNALISGSKILYEDVCGSGDAMGLNSYDTTHYRNLSVEPEKHQNYSIDEEHELGDDACDVNKSGKTGKNSGKSGHASATPPDKISKNNSGGNKSTIHGSLKNGAKGSRKSSKISKAKNQFGNFVDRLKVGQKEKAPLIRGFEEFMNSALKKKFS